MKSIAEQFLNPEGIITDEELIAFAKGRPLGDPEVFAMSRKWAIQNQIPEGQDCGPLAKIQISLKNDRMGYIVGVLSLEDVLESIQENLTAIYSTPEHIGGRHSLLSELNTFLQDVVNDNIVIVAGQNYTETAFLA